MKEISVTNTQLNNGSFANVLLNLPKKQESVRLCVKPKENFKGDVLTLGENQVATKTRAKVLKISKANNESVSVKCSNDKDS